MNIILFLLWKEWLIMKRGYLLYVGLVYFIMNAIMIHSILTLFQIGISVNTNVDPGTSWFALYIGCTFILLSMISSVIAKEKIVGQIHNLLAYCIPFSKLILAKSLFVTIISLVEIPIILGLSLILQISGYNIFTQAFVNSLFLTIFVFPLVILLMSNIVTLVNYIKPQLNQISGIGAFVLAFFSFSYLKSILDSLTFLSNFFIILFSIIVLCGLIWLIIKIANQIPHSQLLN